jgi:hypothetical protein
MATSPILAYPWCCHGQELGFFFKLSFRDFRSCTVRSFTVRDHQLFSGGFSPEKKQGLVHLKDNWDL